MAAERTPGDFGSLLKEARERKGVSLRAIADVTRISVRVLEALERNDISRLPGGIFSRAFVRSYASEIGLDPEATVDDFVRRFPDDSVTVGHPPSTRVDEAESFESDRRVASLGLKLVALSVPIAALVIYFGISGWPWHAASAGASQTTSAQAETAAPAPVSGGSDRVLRLSVEVTASRSCTISSAVDGAAPTDLALEAGGRRSFEVGRDLRMTLSDASAVDVTINGTPTRSLGQAGEEATVHLTLDNYREYLNVR